MRKEEKVDRKLIDIGEQTEGERETTCVRGKSGRFHRFLKMKFNLE